MGSSSSKNTQTMEDVKKIDEAILKNSPLERANNCFTRVSRSICKIEIRNINQGTGFFIKLKANNNENYKYFLMTCEHVIKREFIQNENIEIEINYDIGFKKLRIKLDRYERIIRTFEEIIDLTLIEIIQDDNINEDYFLEPNYKYNGKKGKIYIAQYPAISDDKSNNSNNLYHSNGKILNFDNYYELSYNASTYYGSSGGPIFLENTIEVIGIHKQGGKGENFGDLISPILNIFQNKEEKIYFKSGHYYIGEWKNGLKHGKGKLYYENGNILYNGDFVEDKFEGSGEYTYYQSDYYVNKFRDIIKEGKKTFYDGKLYDGDFIYYESKGYKLDMYKYGNFYKGEWKNGKKHGNGIIYSKDFLQLYEGHFIDDKFEEYKEYLYLNGELYIGGWKNDQRNGKGILYDKNKNKIYDGYFKDDLYNGNGILYFPNGNQKYDCQFLNGKKHGPGKEYTENGELLYSGEFIDDEKNGYFGEMKNGLKHGKGIIYIKGKIKYKGDFINDKYDGEGKYYFKNDNYYIGQFKDGMFHGKGKIYYSNGGIKYEGNFIYNTIEKGRYNEENGNYYIGEFKNWKFDGKGTYYNENGEIINKGDFENGEFIYRKFDGKGIKYNENGKIINKGDFKDDEFIRDNEKNESNCIIL